jgi:peptide deformylase
MHLVTYPDETLRRKSDTVQSVGPETREILREMHSLMLKSKGIGLAAPQVGILQRMFVMDIGDGPRYFVNPIILDLRKGCSSLKEGCLSVPGAYGDVVRPSVIMIKSLDLNGRRSEAILSGLPATVVQHETDHLDGILHVDKMESFVRRKALDSTWTTIQAAKIRLR